LRLAIKKMFSFSKIFLRFSRVLMPVLADAVFSVASGIDFQIYLN